jgi:hypothetical protein
MDTFTNNFIWLDDTVDPFICKQFTGCFQAVDFWGKSILELHLSDTGILTGDLKTGDITFEIKGCINHLGIGFGFLLEPVTSLPVAMFRLKKDAQGIYLESYVPEFSKLFDQEKPDAILFSPVMTTSALEEILIGA